MRKTKIVCTLGPATDREGVLRGMMLAGMNVARFNFSHGTHEGHLERLERLIELREELSLPIASLLDTRGPEIRLGKFKDGSVELKAGQTFVLTPRDVEGDNTISSITFKNLYEDVSVGTHLLVDDGRLEMIISEIKGEDLWCEVLNDAKISDQKGINVPGVRLSMPYLSTADRADIRFGMEHGFDFIAASFTRTARDILDIRTILDKEGKSDIKIIAKIENQEGVSNIDEILTVADGIMIARGDMGVEIDFTEIPIIQKKLIARCYSSGRPAITATQMLDSMIKSPRPTRAEITDVANAIYDGTSAIMLSGETAAGLFPVEAVRTMAAIAERTEKDIPYDAMFQAQNNSETRMSIPAAVAHATCTTAMDTNASHIITVTRSGETARLLSKHRPLTSIIACVMGDRIYRQLALSWGVTPVIMPYARNTDEMVELAVKSAQEAGLVRDGDLTVITAGMPVGISGTTNMIKAHIVGDSLLSGVGIGRKNAIGRVCVCKNMIDIERKFQPGNIMVVSNTSNEMLSALKEATAVISEEGGMSSHAAIVGLTLEKPVIIGASGATTKLSDGQLVTVDPEHGIVRLMPE